MQLLRNIPSRLQRWLSERETGTSLALFRIGVGGTILCSVGRTVLAGLAPAVWLDAKDGGLLPLGEQPWQVELLGGLNPVSMWLIVTATLLLALLMVLGLGGRWTAFALLQAYLGLSFINDPIQGCDDKLLSNALWILVLAHSTATLSLDCRLRSGRWTSAERVAAWPRHLMIWQLVLVYFTTGLQKVSIHWTPAGGFSALYWILQEPTWQRWDMRWLAEIYPVTQFATALTWCWEITFPVILLAMHYRRTADRPGRLRAVFNRLRVRETYLIVGVMLHLGVWLLNDIGPFTWITLSCYFCLLPSRAWDAWAKPQAVDRDMLPRQQPAGWRRTALAGFVAVHLIAVTLAALPLPPGVLRRDSFEHPAVQREIAEWSQRLSSLGLTVSPSELEAILWNAGTSYVAVRDPLLRPFAPYYKYCGTRQGWPMFTGPDTEPVRLSVEIKENGSWRTVFVQSDPRHNWRAGQLGQEHVRTAIHSVADEPDTDEFRALAKWIAARAADDFPHATRIRVRVHRLHVLPPEEAAPDREFPRRRLGEVVVVNGR